MHALQKQNRARARVRERSFADSIRLSPEHPELAAVKRCVRIALERALIECGRSVINDKYKPNKGKYQIAKQVGRDICALHGLDFDGAAIDIDDPEQTQIRALFWPDQQEAARAAIKWLTDDEGEAER